jgi:hypothetical protein
MHGASMSGAEAKALVTSGSQKSTRDIDGDV